MLENELTVYSRFNLALHFYNPFLYSFICLLTHRARKKQSNVTIKALLETGFSIQKVAAHFF